MAEVLIDKKNGRNMATANPGHVESSMSSEAYDLLDCFSSEFSEAIYGIAEEFAKKRHSAGPGDGVLVEEQDIQSAVSMIATAIKHSSEKDEISSEAASHFDMMMDCFKASLQKD